jgi:hypothetical protein
MNFEVKRLRMEGGHLVLCQNGAFVPFEEHESAMELMRREVDRLCSDFAAMRELVINGGHEAAIREAEIERLRKPVIPQPERDGYR